MSATFQPDGAPPAKSTSGLKIVLIVLAVLGLIGLLICGGFAALMYFGWGQFQAQMGEEFRSQLEGNPVLVQEIGELETITVQLTQTRADADSGLPQMVMQVKGTEGSGKVVATISQEGDNRITAAVLETEDGRTVVLPIEGGADDGVFDAGDIDAGEPAFEEPVEQEVLETQEVLEEEAVEAP